VSAPSRARAFYLARLLLASFAVVAALINESVSAQEIDPRQEYKVKAVFLYSFGRYIEWPPETFPEEGSPFIIAVVGHDPFGRTLDLIAKAKTVQGRRIVIRRFPSIEKCGPCHILFVPKTAPMDARTAVIQKYRGASTLLVGETHGFAASGGVINFHISQGTVRFEINAGAANEHGLSIDAKLLSLGRSPGGA
jgi:hypothetical protein